MTASEPGRARAALPGARTSCALLTLLTILLAWPSPPEALRVLVLPCYFALLLWFFWTAGRGREVLQGQPMRLVCGGFLVLWLSFTAAAIVHFAGLDAYHAVFVYLRAVCERGALFLLGLTLISYGLMLWIPDLLRAHAVLERDLDQQANELLVAEHARSELEQRLVEADRRAMLGGLAASIAHDLRNPLTIVVGAAESLCRKPRTPAEIAEHTGVIRRNIDKANDTLSSLIDLGRPRANAPATASAREIVDEVLALVVAEGRRRNLAFTVAVDGSGGAAPTVHADRTLLAQALLNLVLNAVHTSSAGGTVTVRLRRVAPAPGGGGPRRIAIAIEDRGRGVDEAVRMQQFVPFYTTKPDGTGLGLWSCRRIAEELSGRLALYPRHRGGARVTMLLPAEPAPKPAGATATATNAPPPAPDPAASAERSECPSVTC